MCSTGTWDPQMHNSWCRLPKLFDLLSFSIIFIPFRSLLTANHILHCTYEYIPENAPKLNHNKTKVNTEQCPHSCSILSGLSQTEGSRAGMPKLCQLRVKRNSLPVWILRSDNRQWQIMWRNKRKNISTFLKVFAPTQGYIEMSRDHIIDIHVGLCVLPPASAQMHHNDNVNTGWHFERARTERRGKDLLDNVQDSLNPSH